MALSGLISGFFSSIGNFISTLPRSAKALLFLVFLSGIAFTFSLMFTLSGYHCATNDDLYKVSVFRLDQNILLLMDKPDIDKLQSTLIDTKDIGAIGHSDCLLVNYSSTGLEYFYDGWICSDCELTQLIDTNGNEYTEACTGDVYRVPEENKSFLQKTLCGDTIFTNNCEPPLNYFFNQSLQGYECLNYEVCGNMTRGRYWDLAIGEKGEVIKYAVDRMNYNQAIRVECDLITPELTLYSIPIFNFKFWLFAMLLIALITALITVTNLNK